MIKISVKDRMGNSPMWDYEFKSRNDVKKFIEDKSSKLFNSIQLIDYEHEWLIVKMPVSASQLMILGSKEDIDWIYHNVLGYMD